MMIRASILLIWLLIWLFLEGSVHWSAAESAANVTSGSEDEEYSSSTSSLKCVGGYPNGANWTGGKCLLCTCRDGTTECAPDIESCCYRNDLRSNVSQYYEHGEEWKEQCAVCVCNNGVEQCPFNRCDTVRLPPLGVPNCPDPHHVIDECGCKKLHCHNSCRAEDALSYWDRPDKKVREHHHGQQWNKYTKTGECRYCICWKGVESCIEQSYCPETLEMYRCNHSRKRVEMGHCCPTWHCPVHKGCHMSEWGEWGKCSRACGYGISSRHRRITRQRHNSTCPSTSDKRHCILRHCPGRRYNQTDMDLLQPVHLRSRRGCQNVHNNITSVHCSVTKCTPYGLANRPLVEETIKVAMRCTNSTIVHYELFAQIMSCGCMP